MIHAFLLFTGQDGNSLVQEIEIDKEAIVNAESIQFRETAAHSSRDSHNAPIAQYIITLTGIVEFTGPSGMKFTVHPGDVSLVEDTTGSGHDWRLIGDDAWTRAKSSSYDGITRGRGAG